MSHGRRRSGGRRRRREGWDYFEFREDDGKPAEDLQEQRSVGLLALFVLLVVLVVCFTVILKSCEVEQFPV